MESHKSLPDGTLVAWYGDDFSGSADVMEVLARAGLRAVLFLRPPAAPDLARFPGLRAAGVAGSARGPSPEEMDEELGEEEIDLGEEPLEDEMSEELPLDDEDEDVDYLDKSDDLLGNSGDDYDER